MGEEIRKSVDHFSLQPTVKLELEWLDEVSMLNACANRHNSNTNKPRGRFYFAKLLHYSLRYDNMHIIIKNRTANKKLFCNVNFL